ncbi:MAG: TonB-dependent receptor [Pseudomonadota bacterium]|nr:MAG: TonB-dependent receptor [Pseudomonadota bacterium]
MRKVSMTALLLAAGVPVWATQAQEDLEEIVVYGRGERLIGTATAASEGAIAGADLAVRPLLRVAELLEAVPGMIAVQHSGSGKANQYFLRGFNLDHGTDFTTLIDDVPINLRTHGHGQGYLDVNGLMPETVERIDFRKGPYRADLGDNALAGAARITTVRRFARPFLAVEAGDFGWLRAAGGGTTALGGGELTLAGQWKTYDGPWELPEDLKHFSGFAKYGADTSFGRVEASLMSYDARWHPTEQIPERAIGTAICEDEFCALDDTATGRTVRHIATLRLSGHDWRTTLYGQYYDWDMYSDPTYDYQIHQWDERYTFGGYVQKHIATSDVLGFSLGAETRYDDISNVRVDHTEARELVGTLGAHSAREFSLAGFAEAEWKPMERLRLMAGLRADWYGFRTRARLDEFLDPEDDAATVPALEGKDDDAVVSPKFGAAWQVSDAVELYANWGRGFHSNDARGVTASATPVPGLVTGTGAEMGARYQRGSFSLTATLWHLDVDSELKFVGDSNSVEPGPASRRRGYELVGFWRPLPGLAIDATWTGSRARYRGELATPGETRIAGAVEAAGELGVSYLKGPWELSARLRHLGGFPLVEDNTERAHAEQCLNLRAAWKWRGWTLYGELLNVFNARGKDIVYWYETYLPAIDAEPMEGRVSRVEEPRTLRMGLSYRF